MGNLDLSILALAGLLAALGFFSGAIQQVSHWIGLGAAILFSKPAAAALAPALADRMGWPPYLTTVGLSAVAMPIVLIVATLVSRLIINAIVPGDQRNLPDRVTGLFLGAAKGGVIAWVALSVMIAFEKPLAKLHSGVKPAMAESKGAAFTRAHPLFEAPPPSLLDRLKALGGKRDDPALKKALEKGDLSELLKDPRIKKLMEDPELSKALEKLKADQK